MNLGRLFKHLLTPDWMVRRAFPAALMQRIEAAIAASEKQHGGELRFAVEAGLEPAALWREQVARQRAVDVFSHLRVWDTTDNTGVLIYVQFVDRQVEILADRGINARVAPEQWEAICQRMEQAFHQGDFAGGALAAIEEISALLRQHFHAGERNANELSDRPVRL